MNDTKSRKLPYRLTDNVWLLGNYYFNIYYIRGKTASVLVETGITATAAMVVEQLISIDENPDYIIITHPHADHITGLNILIEHYPNSQIIIGQEAVAFLNHPKALEMLFFEDQYMTECMRNKGLSNESRFIDRLPSFEKVIPVDDKMNIELGDTSLSIMSVKGHAPGHVNVYIPQKGLLIASDSLGFHYPGRGFLPLFFTGYSEYLNTIDRLATYKVEFLGLGHQGPITGEGVTRAFSESRDATIDIKNKIQLDLKNKNRILEPMVQEFYKDELTLYSKENIQNCCKLLIKRIQEIV